MPSVPNSPPNATEHPGDAYAASLPPTTRESIYAITKELRRLGYADLGTENGWTQDRRRSWQPSDYRRHISNHEMCLQVTINVTQRQFFKTDSSD